jgi:ParB/RepB/Spo0J family partition protein
MINMKIIHKVPLQEIDSNDDTFSVNFMEDLEKLRSSIKAVGLIQPVLLKEERGGHKIVCGFRRISVLQGLGISEVDARVVSAQEMDDLQLFSIALHENVATRGLNNVEIAVALDKLVHRFQVDPKVVVASFLPLCGQETNEKILYTFLSLAAMEESVKKYIIKEGVSRSNIRRIAALSRDDREALLSLVAPLRLGENRLREILTLADEISRRGHRPVREIVACPEIQEVLVHKELTPSQKTERVKKTLANLRYPRMHELEERFEHQKRKLDLPPSLSLRHQPYFESKGFKMEFEFKTLEEYESILSSLSLLSGKKEFKELLGGMEPLRQQKE